MSSMVRSSCIAALLTSGIFVTSPALAQGNEWDQARASLVARQPGAIAAGIARWEQLSATPNMGFDDYSGFLMSYPGFPDEAKLRGYAEGRLNQEFVPPERIVAFFDRFPPVTNSAKAHYALALMSVRPDAAEPLARASWRGGEMGSNASAAILGRYGSSFTTDDQDARMDALLWQRDRAGAERQIGLSSPGRYEVFRARLAILQGADGSTSDAAAMSDPGYLYNRSRELRQKSRTQEAASMLANRPPLAQLPFDQTAWVTEQLNVAKGTGARSAVQIAARIDEAFAPGDDVSTKSFRLRDDYTSLMWLGGTRALWELGDAASAAPLFYRYGAAARTPQTRSKGFFWAGRAMAQAGDAGGAQRYYEMAAQYGDRFYGQMALKELGRPLPNFADAPQGQPTAEERAAFQSAPITLAVSEVARDAPWSTGIRFYRAIADQAETIGQHVLVAELARNIGRRDLAVNLADAAAADGHPGFIQIGFPTLVPPPGTDWTIVHAITRQESQFAQNAVSHAGARGLMQLMPGTAREEAQKAGMSYLSASLVDDAGYNVQLGSNHFQRLLARYDGSYPLAIAAYNAGPGNVNKWLNQNGDPRSGAISWLDWVEKIPFFETKNYVTRVIENAVVYEALHPDKSTWGRARGVDEFLR
ncbi:transglycosylase SLT domain-containing protein [Altererythrobacter xixiisoli]|uniref:Transglycosylase SLT domain-containing protein n=2 Tax=Croceibacterium xixiisoli TaxID=1476466 RepID=A0A6I4TSN4_9SPHN|nr:lytic transglycosylase domain-containing protein [Croceibacterium xixiisoli]MXO98902.1 transglycosylase SLT domain-containing protein [Croceibacterium xixiisoli]